MPCGDECRFGAGASPAVFVPGKKGEVAMKAARKLSGKDHTPSEGACACSQPATYP